MEEKLIEAVRGRKVLYDTSHEDYLKTKLKTRIWDEVAKEIGMQSGSEAKLLWEKLRHSLRDALRRQSKCSRSGAGATTSKPWKFQKQMGFLQPLMENRKRESNFMDSDEESTTKKRKEMESEDVHDLDSVVECTIVEHADEELTQGTDSDFPENPKSTDLSLDSPSGSSTRENLRTPRKQFRKKEDVTLLLKQSLENRAKRSAERAAERALLVDKISPTDDPLYSFFICMYQTAKSLPPTWQNKLKNQIYKSVTDMEAAWLTVSNTDSPPAPQSSQYDLQPRYSEFPSEDQEERSLATLISQFSDKA